MKYTDLCAQGEPKSAIEAKLCHVEEELHMMKTSGIIEVAVRNPSVADYMQHWEARAEAAEARVAELTRERDAVEALVKAANALHADMLERARVQIDAQFGDQYRIVNAGRTAWYDFDAAVAAIRKGATP